MESCFPPVCPSLLEAVLQDRDTNYRYPSYRRYIGIMEKNMETTMA